MEDGSLGYYRVPEGVAIHVVDTEDAAVRFEEALSAACVVGLDAEWKPREGGGRKGKPPPAALLQVACRGQGKDVIFLLDILQQPRIFTSVIQGLLRNKDIVKVGFHVMSDLQALARGLGGDGQAAVAIVDPYVDASSLRLWARRPGGGGGGLSSIVHEALGRPLDKAQQCSDWEERPLSGEQIAYAAADAYCLLEILAAQHEGGGGGGAGAGREWAAAAAERWGGRLDANNPQAYRGGAAAGGGQPRREKKTKKPPPPQPDDVEFEVCIPWGGGGEPKFLTDTMCRGLSKQLRMCGIDSEAACGTGGARGYRALVETAEREGRVILTHDTKFIRQRYTDQAYLVKAVGKLAQLDEVLSALQVPVHGSQLMSRCVHCNGELELDGRSAEDLVEFAAVPESIVREHLGDIWACCRCRHVYWPGGQYKRALSNMERERGVTAPAQRLAAVMANERSHAEARRAGGM